MGMKIVETFGHDEQAWFGLLVAAIGVVKPERFVELFDNPQSGRLFVTSVETLKELVEELLEEGEKG